MDYVEPLVLEFDVRGFDCGYGGPLRPFALANYLQEAAGAHATLLGVGIPALLSRRMTWMLSRVDIRVDDSPEEGERVAVATWPAGAERLFAMRDFRMTGSGGRPLARAVYAYLVVDADARKPLRPQTLFGDRDLRGREPHPIEGYRFDLPAAGLGAAEPAFAERAWGRHIDLNGHVNNAHILDWLADAPPPAEREGMRASAIRAEFKSEVIAGDELEASYARVGGEGGGPAFLSTLSRAGAPVARALVEWGRWPLGS
jgi:medium-chain acyl-[acyl-carrier-protein] hydrolase